MEMGVGGFVHVGLGPFLEAVGSDGIVLIVAELVSVEIVAGTHLQEPVSLLAHLINKYNILPNSSNQFMVPFDNFQLPAMIFHFLWMC